MVQVRQIASDATHDLRRRVLRNGDPAAVVRWPKDDDAGTVHFGAFVPAVPSAVAIGTLYRAPLVEQAHALGTLPHEQWQFRGMASDPAVRGSGAGRAIMLAMIEHARNAGGKLLWCNARIGALGFYEKLGMRVVGGQFEIAGVGPHKVMVLGLGESETRESEKR